MMKGVTEEHQSTDMLCNVNPVNPPETSEHDSN